MALRSIAADLVRLLDAVSGAVYVLDDKRRILFVNDACAAWAGCSAGELIGQESRYHSSSEVMGPPAIAAALSPPPEVWTGQRAAAVVSLAGRGWQSSSHATSNSCLSVATLDMTGVMAFASPHQVADRGASDTEATHSEESPRELHHRLAEWRRKLAGHYHADRLVGDSLPSDRCANRSSWPRRARRACRSSDPRGVAGSTQRERFTTGALRNRLGRSCRSPARCWQ